MKPKGGSLTRSTKSTKTRRNYKESGRPFIIKSGKHRGAKPLDKPG